MEVQMKVFIVLAMVAITVKGETQQGTEDSTSTEEIKPEKVAVPASSNSRQAEDINEVKNRKERIEARIELGKAAHDIQNQLTDIGRFAGNQMALEGVIVMENAATNALDWLDRNEDADVKDILEQKSKLSDIVRTVILKMITSTDDPEPTVGNAETGNESTESESIYESGDAASAEELDPDGNIASAPSEQSKDEKQKERIETRDEL